MLLVGVRASQALRAGGSEPGQGMLTKKALPSSAAQPGRQLGGRCRSPRSTGLLGRGARHALRRSLMRLVPRQKGRCFSPKRLLGL